MRNDTNGVMELIPSHFSAPLVFSSSLMDTQIGAGDSAETISINLHTNPRLTQMCTLENPAKVIDASETKNKIQILGVPKANNCVPKAKPCGAHHKQLHERKAKLFDFF